MGAEEDEPRAGEEGEAVRIGRLITEHPVTLEFDTSNTSWDMLVLKNFPLSEISLYWASCIFLC